MLREEKPSYTPDLMRRKLEDIVLLDAVVGIDGSVTAVRTVYGMYAEFSAEAMRAARLWRFSRPTLNGQPVPARVSIQLTFTLR